MLDWILPHKDHVIFGVGFPDAEILSERLSPSLTEMDEGILEVNLGGAVGCRV